MLMTGPGGTAAGLDRLRLYASAVAGRTVDVVAAEPGELSWTDGTTVFLDASADPVEQIRMLSVQASLLAAGSLAPPILHQLSRRPKVAARYLRIETHRALAANEALLPAVVRSLVDHDIASGVTSAEDSLAIARSGRTINACPTFGTIHARRVLAAIGRDSPAQDRTEIAQAPRAPSNRERAELVEDQAGDQDLARLLSSPVGGRGPIGRLLRRMLSSATRRGRGAPLGADAPTYVRRSSAGSGRGAILSPRPSHAPETVAMLTPRRTTYPEWDVHRGRYRTHWCTVLETDAPFGAGSTTIDDAIGLRRSLARLGMELTPCRRQPQGNDIDVDAAVEAWVDRLAGSPHEDDFYIESLRRRRDLAVLVLLDVSGSAGESGTAGKRVHEHQRTAAAALTVALHELGDRVALFAFNSRGRTAVQFLRIKHFDDRVDGHAARRLDGLAPAAYTRLGAAIRHATGVVEERCGTSRRLLVVVSDGFAYDHGYEGRYGEADARRALVEARRRGLGCLCLSVGTNTHPDALRRVFGAAAHATVPRPEQLSGVIGPLFRAAVASAEVQRRAFQRNERTRERLEVERRTDGGSSVLRTGR
jgi:nitric oxide reductase NorD protein